LEVWAAHFEALEAEKVGVTALSSSLGVNALSPWEEVELPTLEGLRKARDSFKTPKKLWLGSVLVSDSVSVSKLSRGNYLTTIVD
jgi:hypothetical protein